MNLQAVFIDRDGTLGGTGYFIHPRDFSPFPAALEAIRRLRDAGVKVFAFTNQTHIAHGEVTEEEFREQFLGFGFDGVYICPHRGDSDCLCRKPSPGMLRQAAEEHGLDLSRCAVIGDVGSTDMLAAAAVGAVKILVRTGWGEGSLGQFRHTWANVEPDHVAADLAGAVEWLLSGRRYRAVIFDLFGTLIDNMPSAAVQQMNAEIAAVLEVPTADLERAWSASRRDRFLGAFRSSEESLVAAGQLLGHVFSPRQVSAAARIRLEAMRAAMAPRVDAVSTLRALRSRGLKIGLISNCPVETEVLWTETDLAPLVDAPLFSSREHRMKPDHELYHEACRRLGVLPGECMYAGDGGGRELEAAQKLGMHAVLIAAPGDDRHAGTHGAWTGSRVGALSELIGLVPASD